MIDVHRVVEDQARLTSYRATQNNEKAIQLEILIDLTKPALKETEWHDLISTPFRYILPVLPHYSARFRLPYFYKNVFYAASCLQTATYEYSYHFMRQRLHLQQRRKRIRNETGTRTGFSVEVNDSSVLRLHDYPNLQKLLHRSDYSASHIFIKEHPDSNFIVYPSVRDPEHRDNMAILEMKLLGKTIKVERQLSYFYDYKKKLITWIDLKLAVLWEQVC